MWQSLGLILVKIWQDQRRNWSDNLRKVYSSHHYHFVGVFAQRWNNKRHLSTDPFRHTPGKLENIWSEDMMNGVMKGAQGPRIFQHEKRQTPIILTRQEEDGMLFCAHAWPTGSAHLVEILCASAWSPSSPIHPCQPQQPGQK